MSSLRVLWLSHRDLEDPLAGGAERSAREIELGLARRGFKVLALSGAPRHGLPAETTEGLEFDKSGGVLKAHYRALRDLIDFEPDVVVEDLAHVIPWGTGWLRRAPVIAYFRHLHERSLPGQVAPVMRFALSRLERQYRNVLWATSIVTESATGRRDLMDLGFSSEQIALIPPGVDTVLFRPREPSPTPTMVYFGGLKPYKRPEDALMLFAELRKEMPELTLSIIGAGPSLGALQRQAQRLDLGTSIRFLGRLSNDALAHEVARAWLNVHCAVTEGWCLSAMEAAASGVPTVGYRVPGLRDSLSDGTSGILVHDGDLKALGDAAREVLTGHKDWRANARRFALGFTWAETVGAWDTLVKRAAGDWSGPMPNA